MKFHILTLFPEWTASYFQESILGRACEKGLIEVTCHQVRNWALDKHHRVDDSPYGGGAGMVMKADVLVPAIREIKTQNQIQKTILLSPRGKKLDHAKVKELAQLDSLLLVCGRYEGIDQRVIDLAIDEEISIGDYVITGGELAAQIVVDAVARQISGVLGDSESLKEESHADGFLEYPHYTRPEVFEDKKVPDVLLSGDHRAIQEWRKAHVGATHASPLPAVYLALLHHPVTNKNGELVTTSITNFDLHDLARTTRTYGVEKCFIVTPNPAQLAMVDYIKKYWREGIGADFNPDRKEAFAHMEMSTSLEETCLTIQKAHGTQPRLVSTTAKLTEKSISFDRLKGLWKEENKPVLLLFGTGWGLAESVIEKSDFVLEPINGPTDYNHLPVRSAVAIILDRLMASRRTGLLK